jgi:hypothetical protein
VRWAAALLGLGLVLGGGGCLVVGATVAAVGAVTATSIKAASKVTVATVSTTGRVAAAAVTSSGEVTALTMESAARLARTGMVVVVDASNGATAELPWRQGMQLQAATGAGLGGAFRAARVFRAGRLLAADLKQPAGRTLALFSGDVVELHR